MRLFAAAVLAIAPTALAAPPADRFPDAATAYLVAVNGRVLWERKPDLPLPMASLTKVMTGLVVLERGGRPDDWVRVSEKAARATGTRLGLRAGDEIRAGDALAAALVSSSNDACLALAEHVAGSAQAFVELMNRRAAELGLDATHFEDPCGHDAPGHRSTARSLWRLTRAALEKPEFRRLVALERTQVRTRDGRTLSIVTGNALLGRAPGATGVKSGFTPAAGKCLIARAERGPTEVLVVLLGAPDRWWTAARILEAAFGEAASGG
ncbi:MAG TPA: serine hydrolase [Anaeromyxobacteraceae bacterium]|nr:serine hydrolase [Anaeromyxobacteraceae bacterium]